MAGGPSEEPGGGLTAGLPRGRPSAHRAGRDRAAQRCGAVRGFGGRRGPSRPGGALDDLAAVLFPHLDREVTEAMPVASATITDGEWRAIDQRYNIKTKSLAQLGFEGHWLIDRIDPEGYRVVTGVVPAVPRFILVHGFGRAYRRRTAAVWSRTLLPATPPLDEHLPAEASP